MCRHGCIVVEEEQVSAASPRCRLIIRAGKADVFCIANQDHFGKIAGDHLGRAVRGCVIDDDRFQSHALRLIVERFEASLEEFAAIPIGDANGDVDRPIVGEIGHPGRPPIGAALRRAGRFAAGAGAATASDGMASSLYTVWQIGQTMGSRFRS